MNNLSRPEPAAIHGPRQRVVTAFTFSLLMASSITAFADTALDESIERGKAIAADRNAGNCYSCHIVEGAELPGDYGPPLMHMNVRYPDRAALKAQIFDPRVRNPISPMPPYGAHNILTDAELESVVDYIHSL